MAVAKAQPARFDGYRVPDETRLTAPNKSSAGTNDKTNTHPVDRRRPDGAPGTRTRFDG